MELEGLTWPFLESFAQYVRRSGQVVASSGAVVDEQGHFTWPIADISAFDSTLGRGVVTFGGEVRFLAHAGALDVQLIEPWLEVSQAEARLSVRNPSDRSGARLPLARSRVVEAPVVEGLRSVRGVDVTLEAPGAGLLANVYPVGFALDPWVAAVQIH